jgi:phosphatidylglycerophosphate synthase
MKRLIILIVVVCLISALAESFLPNFPYLGAIEVFLIFSVLVYAYFVGHQEYRARRKRDSENEKVEIATSKREEHLSKSEITFLKKKMNRKMMANMGAFLFIFSIYLVAFNFLLPALLGEWGKYLFWILSGVIFFTAVYFFGKRIHQLRQDLRNGKKLVVVGNLSRWENYPYNENDYVFYVDEIAFRVKPAIFEKFAKGDALEVHLFEPWQNAILFIKKIENGQ